MKTSIPSIKKKKKKKNKNIYKMKNKWYGTLYSLKSK